MKIKPFVNLVLLMSEKENKIEIIRQILCEIPDFEPYTIFKQLDKKQQNFIDSEDISDFLNQNREIYSKKTVESTLMDHFAPLEGKITYKMFNFIIIKMI